MGDITPRLRESTHFSKLDVKLGYWNIKLAERSMPLSIFIHIQKGRYKFLRMPFGLNMSQNMFWKKIYKTYENGKGANGIADDIQVYCSDNMHNLHLHKAEERTERAGVKLKFDLHFQVKVS